MYSILILSVFCAVVLSDAVLSVSGINTGFICTSTGSFSYRIGATTATLLHPWHIRSDDLHRVAWACFNFGMWWPMSGSCPLTGFLAIFQSSPRRAACF